VRGDDIGGMAVTIAKRICDLAGPGQVVVSHAVEGAVAGSGIEFNDRGEQPVEGRARYVTALLGSLMTADTGMLATYGRAARRRK
jgi:class 3 adenylate cyclase